MEKKKDVHKKTIRYLQQNNKILIKSKQVSGK